MILENVSLKNKTWFQTGGPAKFYTEPSDAQEFAKALEFARTKDEEVFILGAGANILISDDGFDGLVIHPHLRELEFEHGANSEAFVTVGAGVDFSDLIQSCFNNNVVGLEEFSGIPGTVGGAVFINLHFFQFLLSDFLVNATIIHKDTGKIEIVNNEWFNFGYNQSTLQKREHYLVSATFKVKQATDIEVAYNRGRSDEITRYRHWRYPAHNTCGSFFRNFHNDEVNLELNNKKMIYVAYYLDKQGFKGSLSVGGATVSHQHANMIVTGKDATSNDIVQLARKIQTHTKEKFGIVPQPECLLIGFKEYPLIK